MYQEAARTLLQQAVIVRISVITSEGYPHPNPVWFLLDGDDLFVFTSKNARKALSARANPKGSIAIGGNPVGSPALLVEGDIVGEDDPDHVWTSKVTHHYELPDRARQWLDAWRNDEHVILRVEPRRVTRIS